MKKGIIIALCVVGVFVFCYLFTLIPDYYAKGATYVGEPGWAFGGIDRFWLVLFGILPVIAMIFCQFGKDDRWHFEEVPYRIARVVACIIIIIATYYITARGPFSSALSFFLTIYPIVFLLYIFIFDGPFKDSMNLKEWFSNFGLTIVSGGLFLVVIALSYILAPFAILLPRNLIVHAFGYDLPISAFACVLLAVFEIVDWIVSLPRSSSKKSNRTSATKNTTSSGKLSSSEMATYAKKACAGTLSMRYEYISGNTVYISGSASKSDFWRELGLVSGGANTDGWEVVILNK